MVKSKILTEEEAVMQEPNTDDITNDLPDVTFVEEDPTVLELNEVLKKSGKKNRLNHTVSYTTKVKKSKKKSRENKRKIPTTKNVFNLRKKAQMPDYDAQKRGIKLNISSDNSEGADEFQLNVDQERDDDEKSLENTTTTKPIFGSKANIKPLRN